MDDLIDHADLRPIAMDELFRVHPWDPPKDRMPVAHSDRGGAWSVLLNACSKSQPGTRLLPDGRTIDFRPSPARPADLAALDALDGRDVALLVMCPGGTGRQGTAGVRRLSTGSYRLHIRPAVQPAKLCWADMED